MDMPTSFTHQLLAEEVYESLPAPSCERVTSLSHYYLGAQGGDICFTCPPFNKRENLGHRLHGHSSLLFFRLLRSMGKDDPLVRSYAYGYVTHYAADVAFHSFLARSGSGTLRHYSLERACERALLDGRNRSRRSVSVSALREVLDGSVYGVYRRYALACGYGSLSYASFVRSGRLYLAGVRFLPPLYKKERADGCETLFSRAKRESLRLIAAYEKEGVGARNFAKRLSDGEETVRAEAEVSPILQKKEKKIK